VEEEMPRIDEETKERRKELVWLEVRQHNGIRQIDIAEKLNIENRTVNNYLHELEEEGKVIKEGVLWHSLPYHETRLRRFTLSPEEAMVLYLATRLFVKQQDKRNEPAESALYRLAEVLTSDAHIGYEIRQAAQELAQRPSNPQYRSIFREIIRGYIYRRKVAICYRPLKGPIFETVFATYLIEPSAIGFSTYIIGHSKSQYVDDIRSYKMERILSATMKNEPYTVPPEFPGLDILRNAWSIISGEETERVTLRFGPDKVRRRVLETQWHPSQDHKDDPDKPGYLRWWVDVADTTDMKPWIRSWGADVEVLAPEGLRDTLKHETYRLAQLYNLSEGQAAQTIIANHQYFGHSKEGFDKSHWQSLKEHLVNTAKLAAEFGQDAGISELARVAGLLHDIGKYSEAFQRRLEGSKRRVDHSTAGAKEITSLIQDHPQKTFADILAYCIAGHHTGLPDFGSKADVEGDGTLLARLDKSKLEDYSAYKTEIDPADLNLPERLSLRPIKNYKGKSIPGFSVSFLTRMVFSALVDADYQETETYMRGRAKPRGGYASIEELRQTFNQFLQKFDNPIGELNKKRTETLKACIARSSEKPGFFTLTVPTGGAKTFASMGFALNHATLHDMKRIIYVLPFTSIIEQNAAEFKKCLGRENVLEHHANFDWEQKRKAGSELPDNQSNNVYTKLKLAAENWDIPIIVTTNVQFFESVFANRSSRCRKLHNLAQSVIIFDEAQMLPREFIEPCMNAVQELVQNYGASAVFCTATQPSLERFLAPNTPVMELAQNPQALFDFYRRVQVNNKGKVPDDDLLKEMCAHSQVLCIVNTRKHAKGLFDGLAGIAREGCFHLSTLMCPAHRKETLAAIRKRLKKGKVCRVVSTQVMEAGIDVDFPVGYRSIAGLDSIIQAAGRVNREGKQESGELHVFEPETPFIKKTPTFVKQGADVSGSILRDYRADPASIEAINAYFKMLYMLQNERAFDAREILPCFEKGLGELNFDFKTAAERFKLIDSNTVPVIVRYNKEARQLIEELKYTLYPASTLRKLQLYTVNIYEREFESLQSKGVIDTYHEKYEVLNNPSFYDERTGLILPADDGGEALFFD
jgi:CRISPR-associated endonuclease/helicase Cas3